MIEFWSRPCCESPRDLGEVIFFFFLLTSKSFVCKTWRMIWLQLHGSKARTSQVVPSCGSVDEPHVPLGAAEELALVCDCTALTRSVRFGDWQVAQSTLKSFFLVWGAEGQWEAGASRELVPAGTGPVATAPRQLWLQVAVITSQRFSCVRDTELLFSHCPARRKQCPCWKRGTGDRQWVVWRSLPSCSS